MRKICESGTSANANEMDGLASALPRLTTPRSRSALVGAVATSEALSILREVLALALFTGATSSVTIPAGGLEAPTALARELPPNHVPNGINTISFNEFDRQQIMERPLQ